MFEHRFYPSLVPTFWKSISCSHFRFFFMRRLNATSGLPVNSYPVTTKTVRPGISNIDYPILPMESGLLKLDCRALCGLIIACMSTSTEEHMEAVEHSRSG